MITETEIEDFSVLMCEWIKDRFGLFMHYEDCKIKGSYSEIVYFSFRNYGSTLTFMSESTFPILEKTKNLPLKFFVSVIKLSAIMLNFEFAETYLNSVTEFIDHVENKILENEFSTVDKTVTAFSAVTFWVSTYIVRMDDTDHYLNFGFNPVTGGMFFINSTGGNMLRLTGKEKIPDLERMLKEDQAKAEYEPYEE